MVFRTYPYPYYIDEGLTVNCNDDFIASARARKGERWSGVGVGCVSESCGAVKEGEKSEGLTVCWGVNIAKWAVMSCNHAVGGLGERVISEGICEL